jgi:hypothetical protein
VSLRRSLSVYRYFFQPPRISPVIRVGEVPGSNPGAPIFRNPSTGTSSPLVVRRLPLVAELLPTVDTE